MRIGAPAAPAGNARAAAAAVLRATNWERFMQYS
jgi:hypothetical protein